MWFSAHIVFRFLVGSYPIVYAEKKLKIPSTPRKTLETFAMHWLSLVRISEFRNFTYTGNEARVLQLFNEGQNLSQVSRFPVVPTLLWHRNHIASSCC